MIVDQRRGLGCAGCGGRSLDGITPDVNAASRPIDVGWDYFGLAVLAGVTVWIITRAIDRATKR